MQKKSTSKTDKEVKALLSSDDEFFSQLAEALASSVVAGISISVSSNNQMSFQTFNETVSIPDTTILDREQELLVLDDGLLEKILPEDKLEALKMGDLLFKKTPLNYKRVLHLALHCLATELFLHSEKLTDEADGSCLQIRWKGHDVLPLLLLSHEETVDGLPAALEAIKEASPQQHSDIVHERVIRVIDECTLSIDLSKIMAMKERLAAHLEKLERDESGQSSRLAFGVREFMEDYEHRLCDYLPGFRIKREGDKNDEWYFATRFANPLLEVKGLLAKWNLIEGAVDLVYSIRGLYEAIKDGAF